MRYLFWEIQVSLVASAQRPQLEPQNPKIIKTFSSLCVHAMRYRTKYQDNRIACRAQSTLSIDARISKIELLLIEKHIIDD